MVVVFLFIAAFLIFYMNILMERFCLQKEIPEEKHPKILQTANISTMILLVSAYIEVLFT